MRGIGGGRSTLSDSAARHEMEWSEQGLLVSLYTGSRCSMPTPACPPHTHKHTPFLGLLLCAPGRLPLLKLALGVAAGALVGVALAVSFKGCTHLEVHRALVRRELEFAAAAPGVALGGLAGHRVTPPLASAATTTTAWIWIKAGIA